MNDKSNTYAIAALNNRRATLVGEIIRFKQGIRDRKGQLHTWTPSQKEASVTLGGEDRGLRCAREKVRLCCSASEDGATAIEYGLIAAGISVAIIATLGTKLNSTFTTVSNA